MCAETDTTQGRIGLENIHTHIWSKWPCFTSQNLRRVWWVQEIFLLCWLITYFSFSVSTSQKWFSRRAPQIRLCLPSYQSKPQWLGCCGNVTEGTLSDNNIQKTVQNSGCKAVYRCTSGDWMAQMPFDRMLAIHFDTASWPGRSSLRSVSVSIFWSFSSVLHERDTRKWAEGYHASPSRIASCPNGGCAMIHFVPNAKGNQLPRKRKGIPVADWAVGRRLVWHLRQLTATTNSLAPEIRVVCRPV